MFNTLKNKQCFNSTEDTIFNYKEYKMFNTSMHTQCLQWRIYILKFRTRIPATPFGPISFIFIQFSTKKSIIRPWFLPKINNQHCWYTQFYPCTHTHGWGCYNRMLQNINIIITRKIPWFGKQQWNHKKWLMHVCCSRNYDRTLPLKKAPGWNYNRNVSAASYRWQKNSHTWRINTDSPFPVVDLPDVWVLQMVDLVQWCPHVIHLQ